MFFNMGFFVMKSMSFDQVKEKCVSSYRNVERKMNVRIKKARFLGQIYRMGRIVGLEPMNERFTAACVNLFTISAIYCRQDGPVCKDRNRLQLSVVEFDNLSFIDFRGEFTSFRKSGEGSFDLVGVDGDISRDGRLGIDGLKNDFQRLGSILEGDGIIDRDEIGRDIDLLAVDGDMTVGDKLSGLSSGSCKTHSEDKIV